MTCQELVERVDQCPPGKAHWQEFADACLAVLRHLFVPPLKDPHVEYETQTLSGTDRRDVIFSNRVIDPVSGGWGWLRFELDAKLVIVDFKNGARGPNKRDVLQVVDYLRPEMGRLAIICSSQPPARSALVKRNQKFADGEKPVVIFLLPHDLREMCERKDRDEDPADLLVDLVERFYMQRE